MSRQIIDPGSITCDFGFVFVAFVEDNTTTSLIVYFENRASYSVQN